jgi:hypothetical protein
MEVYVVVDKVYYVGIDGTEIKVLRVFFYKYSADQFAKKQQKELNKKHKNDEEYHSVSVLESELDLMGGTLIDFT